MAQKKVTLDEQQIEYNRRVLETYVERLGGSLRICKKYDVTRQAIHLWKTSGKIPAYAVKDICEIYKIRKYMLRPDIYDKRDA